MASSTTLIQSSIHDFLSSIPSQASDLAINAVNTYIEDQIADPKKLSKNIGRVRSVFSKCKRNGGAHDGGGDCPNLDTKFLLTLPRKIRIKIWQELDDESVKVLRMVCSQLRHEMDYEVGLFVVLNTNYFNNSLWMRSISVRSCLVKGLDNIMDLNKLANPEKLEKLSFDSEFYMDADITELIIRKFRNLRQLVIYTEDISELNHEYEEAWSNGHSSNLITRLEDQFQLVSVDVKFDTSKWKLKWNLKLKPQKYEKVWRVEDAIGQFGCSGIVHCPCRDLSKKSLHSATLSIPFVQDYDRVIWLKVLHAQNVLVSLTCDLNATHWKEYAGIVQANRKTLTKLFLLNIVTFSVISRLESRLELMELELEEPFDWKMFEGCDSLQEVTLIADTFMRHTAASKTRRYMANVNLTLLGCPMLRALWVENFNFSEAEVEFLRMGPNDQSRLELCTLKNCKVDQEEIAEKQVGRKKGRNRSLECLCFGTLSYDDDDLKRFKTYSENLSQSVDYNSDIDMIEHFQCLGANIKTKQELNLGSKLIQHADIIGGLILTAWLAWC